MDLPLRGRGILISGGVRGIEYALARAMIEAGAQDHIGDMEAGVERFNARSSLRRMAREQDIAYVSAFAAGASRETISGQRISIFGNLETTRG